MLNQLFADIIALVTGFVQAVVDTILAFLPF